MPALAPGDKFGLIIDGRRGSTILVQLPLTLPTSSVPRDTAENSQSSTGGYSAQLEDCGVSSSFCARKNTLCLNP